MIVNILRFSFSPETSAEEQAEVLATMRRTASVESVSFATVGQDINPGDGYTHAYCVGIADLAALKRYMHDPVHLAGDPSIIPRLAKLSAVRFSDDPDPEIDRKILALHLEKVAIYPDWGRQLAELMSGQDD